MANKNMMKKIVGALLLIAGILLPAFTINTIKPGIGMGILSLIVLIDIIIVAISAFLVKFINKGNLSNRVIGYLVFTILAMVPGFSMMTLDRSYDALGTAYYNAILLAILAWWGITLIYFKEEN